MLISDIEDYLCKELDINYEIQIEYADLNVPMCYPDKGKIQIVRRQNWNEIYRLSHEFLHISFYEHNENTFAKECIWIEEIVCEAYSIMCLERFARNERIQWFGYLYNDFYIRNGNVNDVDTVSSIDELNKKVSGYKEFCIRQFIHPTALRIKSVIEGDNKELIKFLDYQKYVEGSRLALINDNKILQILFDFQESIEN